MKVNMLLIACDLYVIFNLYSFNGHSNILHQKYKEYK